MNIVTDLGCDPAELLGNKKEPELDAAQPVITKPLPMYGEIVAGDPAPPHEALETYEVLAHLASPGRYVLRVAGNSMAPTIRHRDLILVDNEAPKRHRLADLSGQILAVLLNGQATLKKLFVERKDEEEVVMLKGDNPDSHPIMVGSSDELLIQGVVTDIVHREL